MNVEEKHTKIRFDILAIVCIVIFCISIVPITLQNDTYYTIKIGELIVNNGVDMQDHFSWHENLPYTYPHWAYDTGIYLIFHLGEMTGIQDGGMIFLYGSTVFFTCLLGLLMYTTAKKISKNELISFILTLLSMYLLIDFIAARAQLVTFNLFVLIILFIENFLESHKKRYLVGIVLISIIIANVHVAVWPFFFVLFMPYIAEYIIAILAEKNIISKVVLYSVRKDVENLEKRLAKAKNEKVKSKLEAQLQKAKNKEELVKEKEEKIIIKNKERRENPYKIKIVKKDGMKWIILVMLLCTLTGLLTPLHDTPYTYLVKTMQGNTTKSISEHQPLTLYNEKDIMIAMSLIFIVLIFTDVKMEVKDMFMVGGLIVLSFMSRRQTSLLVMIGVFSFAKWLEYLAHKYDKNGSMNFMKLMTTNVGKVIVVGMIVLISAVFFKGKVEDKFVDDKKYPVEASTWILENLDVQNIKLFNEYNYGSYLLYRGIPVFIDSRADLYAPEFNKQDGEEKGRDIFSDYINTSSIGTYYESKMEDYEITHVIIKNNSKLNMFLSRDSKYKELYKDDNFTVYQRNAE